MTKQILNASAAATATATMFFPKRVDGSTWDIIEATLPIARVRDPQAEGGFKRDSHNDWYQVLVPAGWTMTESPLSPWRRQIVDENGVTQIDLFFKSLGGGSIAIARGASEVNLPTRGNWDEIEATLPIKRVANSEVPGEFVRGKVEGFQVSIPAGWRLQQSQVGLSSPWRWALVDAHGAERLTVFRKPHGGGSVEVTGHVADKLAA